LILNCNIFLCDCLTNSLEQLKNTNEYWYLAQQVAQFQMRFQKIQTGEQKKHIENLSQSPKFHNSGLATNFKSKLYFYQINSTYQFMLGNVEKAYEINSQFLDFLDSNPHFLVLYAERYLATLNNMLIDSLVIGKYEILDEGINRLAMTLERPEFKSIKNIDSRVFRQRYVLLINWSLSQQDFEKAMEWIPEIEQGLEQFGKKIEKHHRITFYYLVAYLLFQNKRYEQALKWNNLILNEMKEDVVKEIFHFARILNLIIHFELENYDLLDSILLSTPKYLKSRRTIYETEKALFRFLRKLLNTINKKERQKLIVDFREEIDGLFAQPKEKRVFNYLDLRLWVKS
jgi:tetratricopeptide (TPR) repeat protein